MVDQHDNGQLFEFLPIAGVKGFFQLGGTGFCIDDLFGFLFRPAIKKQIRYVNSFIQHPARIPTEVENESLHPLAAQVPQCRKNFFAGLLGKLVDRNVTNILVHHHRYINADNGNLRSGNLIEL